MLAYLQDEMIVLALLETNNVYRFGQFAKVMIDEWTLNENDPIPIGSSFIDCFQIWLHTNYQSNEGNHDWKKVKEGFVWYSPSNNNPTLVLTSYSSIRSFHEQMMAARKRTVSDAEF